MNQIVIKKCHLQGCNRTFIDEWSHRWDWHPDSSSHRWVWHPDLFESIEIKKAASTAMELDEGSGLRDITVISRIVSKPAYMIG